MGILGGRQTYTGQRIVLKIGSVDYVWTLTQTPKFGPDRPSGGAPTWWCTGHTERPILMPVPTKHVVPRKEVPFGGQNN